MAETLSKKDSYFERIRKRNPDLNVDDEESYYDFQNKLMDEYESYEESSNNLRSHIEKSPLFAEMMVASKKQEGFDPIVWAVENGKLNIEALQNDPDYAKKLAKASQKAMERRAKQDDIDKQMEENMPVSIESIRMKAKEMNLSDEQAEEVIGHMYQIMNDLIVGKIDSHIFELIAKGQNYDAGIEAAREEGVAEGLNTKVNERLRTLPNKIERTGGKQSPIRERAINKNKNPFIDRD